MGQWVPNPPQDDVGSKTFIDLVTNRFELTQSFAQEAFDSTKLYIQELQETLNSFQVPSTGTITDIEQPYIPEMSYTARPALSSLELVYQWPTDKPHLGEMLSVPAIPEFELPIFSVQSPNWQTPSKPSFSALQEPGDAPPISTPDMPAAPSLNMPTAPVLSAIALPAAPDIVLPEFDGTLLLVI